MRILIALFAFTSFFLFSCQKEIDFGTGSNNSGGSGGNKPATLLIKKVDKTGADSLVTLYTYNSDKKVINIKVTGTDHGTPVDKEYRYYRNASGIVTQYSTIDADLIAVGVDSITTIVFYNSSTSRYAGYLININVTGFVLLDSSVYVYDGSGKSLKKMDMKAHRVVEPTITLPGRSTTLM